MIDRHRIHALAGDENLAAIGGDAVVLGLDGKRQAHQSGPRLCVENAQRARATIANENLAAVSAKAHRPRILASRGDYFD